MDPAEGPVGVAETMALEVELVGDGRRHDGGVFDAAVFDRDPVEDRPEQCATTLIVGFDDHDVEAGASQVRRTDEPVVAAADDHDVGSIVGTRGLPARGHQRSSLARHGPEGTLGQPDTLGRS